MKMSNLFSSKHADYYVEQTFGLGSSSALFSPSQLIELLGSLHQRMETLETRIEGLEFKVKELEKQLKKKG